MNNECRQEIAPVIELVSFLTFSCAYPHKEDVNLIGTWTLAGRRLQAVQVHAGAGLPGAIVRKKMFDKAS